MLKAVNSLNYESLPAASAMKAIDIAASTALMVSSDQRSIRLSEMCAECMRE